MYNIASLLNICCRGCLCLNNIPPTIQIQTDLDYNSPTFSEFEFITFNYKGDAQYYNTENLRGLSSGILPVIVYPSISPLDKKNNWPLFCFTSQGNGNIPSDINPNLPYNDGKCPSGWDNFSAQVNQVLATFNYQGYGEGSLLPQSSYLQNSISHHPGKTVSLFCALYHTEKPDNYLLKLDLNQDLSFYVLDVQNGD